MSSKLSKKQFLIILAVFVVVVGGYFLVTSNLRKDSKPPDITLTIWGPPEEAAAIGKLTEAYTGLRPNVKFRYEKVSWSTYRDAVLESLAGGRAPDILLIDNRSLSMMKNKLAPAPQVAVPPATTVSLTKVRSTFPAVVERDFTDQGAVYALPVFIDTLALIYNKESFDQANIAAPPATWDELEQVVPILRTLNENGQITRAGAALGGTLKTMPHGGDIVSVMMLQRGSDINTGQPPRVSFGSGGERDQTLAALSEYLQFANAASPAYTWNENQPYAPDALPVGRVAMMVGYQSDAAEIARKNPFARIGVAPLPQVEGATGVVNYAKYWGFAVSWQSPNIPWAWDFITQAATNEGVAQAYAETSGRVPAMRNLLSRKYDDPLIGVFASQALTARSWQQPDGDAVAQIFDDVLGSVLRGQIDSRKALQTLQDQVNGLIKT